MITEGILNFVFSVLSGFLRLLPDISWNVQETAFNTFLDFLKVICYILPMPTVLFILTTIIAVTVFRIIISLIKTIWDLLPLV